MIEDELILLERKKLDLREDKLILRREDFLYLRDARNHPQRNAGVITSSKIEGIIYSTGVFPRSSQKSFIKALEGVNCYEILGNLNSIVIPYIVGDSKDAFAEILEIDQKSFGLISEFCFARERETRIYTPVNSLGIITLQPIPYSVVSEKRIMPKVNMFLKEQNASLNRLLSSDLTVECH